jgi:hypothetical protein
MNRRGERVRIGDFQVRPHAHGSGALYERHVDSDGLDPDSDKHRVDDLRSALPAVWSGPIRTSV